MHIKQTKMICSVQGCRNTDTVFASKNGVCVNTPNICRECIKNIYEAVFAFIETPKASAADSVANADVNVQDTDVNVRNADEVSANAVDVSVNVQENVENADVVSESAVEASASVRESGANAVKASANARQSQPKPSAKSRGKGR